MKFDNRKKPSLKIIKLDSQTNKPLSGATFKVQETENATISEYVTDANGEILIPDLEESIYSVWESAAPDGYVCNPEHKDIQLTWGTTKQLIFTDTEKPKLEIKKVDEATGIPLANAKFRVTATESKTTSEYVTDSTGTILIPNLNEEIYSVDEIVAPKPMACSLETLSLETVRFSRFCSFVSCPPLGFLCGITEFLCSFSIPMNPVSV